MTAPLEIFVLSHNRVNYLRDCLRSILDQTFADFTVTVLDNASEEDVNGLIETFDDRRVRLVVNSSNIGGLANFMKALDLASADYVTIFHDDDCMSPRLLECQIRLFREYPDLTFVSSGINLVFRDAAMFDFRDAGGFRFELFRSPFELLHAFFRSRVFGFGSIMYNRKIAKQARPNIERFANVFDRPYMLSLASHGPCAILISPSYNARQHAAQDSGSRSWSYINEIELGRYYLDLNRLAKSRSLRNDVIKMLAQNYSVRRPRVPLRKWLRTLAEREMLYWNPLCMYLLYYILRDTVVRHFRSVAPIWYQEYIRARALGLSWWEKL